MVNSASFIFLNTSAVRSFTCCGVNTEGEKERTHAGFLLASPISLPYYIIRSSEP